MALLLNIVLSLLLDLYYIGRVFSRIVFIFPRFLLRVICSTINWRMQSFERWNKHIMWFQCAPTNKRAKGAAVVFSTWFCTKTMSISYFSRGVLTLMKQMQFNAEQFAHFKACVIKKKIAKVLKWSMKELKWNFTFLQSWFSNHFCVNTNPFGHKIQGKAT